MGLLLGLLVGLSASPAVSGVVTGLVGRSVRLVGEDLLAAPPASRNQIYAGFGYAMAYPRVTIRRCAFPPARLGFATSCPDLAEELRRIGSPIAVDREVCAPVTGMWMPGPQLRDNNMIFNRKGFSLPKRPIPFPGAAVPFAHSFETLVAKADTFMGVATINDEMHPMLTACNQTNGQLPGCDLAWRHLHEWTHFILATQLSTYPAY